MIAKLGRAAAVLALLITTATTFSLASAGPAAAGACYAGGSRVATDAQAIYVPADGAFVWRSEQFWYVDPDTPCRPHDVNVRSSWGSFSHGYQCVSYRIRFAHAWQWPTPWHRVCRGWTELYYDAAPGTSFVLESYMVPASVVVRT